MHAHAREARRHIALRGTVVGSSAYAVFAARRIRARAPAPDEAKRRSRVDPMPEASVPAAHPEPAHEAPAPAGGAASVPSGNTALRAGDGVPDEPRVLRLLPIAMSEARREAVLAAYAENPSMRYAARVAGCSEGAVRQERDRDPEFAEALRIAADSFKEKARECAAASVMREMQAYLAGEPIVETEDAIAHKTAEVVQLRKTRPRPFPRDAVRFAFNHVDPSWTQPKQEVEVTTFEQLVANLPPLPGKARVIEDAEVREIAPAEGHEALPPPTTLPEEDTT